MNTYILAAGNSKKIDLTSLRVLPQFRKATTNMIMATAAVKDCLKDIGELKSASPWATGLAIVLGSSYGEAEITKDFLFTLDQTGVARPFLFQNSLHNATLGFVTQHFGIQGPAVTVSKRYFTGETILETAMILLEGRQSPLSLAVAVDALVPSLGDAYKEIYPPRIELSETATAVLLANDEGLKLLANIKPIGVLEDISYLQTDSELDPSIDHNIYNDSNGIEKLYNEMSSQRPQFNLNLPKPDRSSSLIKWSRL